MEVERAVCMAISSEAMQTKSNEIRILLLIWSLPEFTTIKHEIPSTVMHYLYLFRFLWFAPINRLGKCDCFYHLLLSIRLILSTSLSVCVTCDASFWVLLFKLFLLDFHCLLSIIVASFLSTTHSLRLRIPLR